MKNDPDMILEVVFFKTKSKVEPVRVWLRSLPAEARKTIGEDIKTVQFGWPLGMPLVRKLSPELWEVRSKTKDGIVRILFTVLGDIMVLLHGFAKKSQKTPRHELETAQRRLRLLKKEETS